MLQTTNQISYFGVKLNHVKSIEKSNSTAKRLCFAHAESVREVAESTLGSCQQSFQSFPRCWIGNPIIGSEPIITC